MASAMDEEELRKKGGVDLFKELLRLLPTADLQDYHKSGVWQDAIMRLDIRILEGHRQEAGSPEPIPLEEVRMPELPKAASNVPLAAALKILGKPTILSSAGKVAPKLLSVAGKAAPKLTMPLTPAQVAAKATLLKKSLLRPGAGKVGIVPKATTTTGAAEGGSEASSEKSAVAKLPPKAGENASGKTIPVPKARTPLVKAVFPQGGKPTNIKLGPLAKAAKFGKPSPAKDLGGGDRPARVDSDDIWGLLDKDVPASSSSASSVPTPTSSPSSGGANVAKVVDNDLRTITAFVNKWKLDQSKAKMALAKLSPQKRSYVMANFKNQNAANGMSPIQKLESYINQCERLHSWDSPTAGVQPTGANYSTHSGQSPTASGQSPVKRPTGARTIPAPSRPPQGARELAARSPAVAGRKPGFAGMSAKIAALRKTSSTPAKAFVTRTMAPKAPGRVAAPRPSPVKVGKWSSSSSSGSGSSWGKGGKPIGGTTAIGQGSAKRPYSSVASASWPNDQKRQRTESSAGYSSSGSWGSGQSQNQSTPHAVAKGWAVPHAAAKAAVVAPKAPPRPVVVGAPKPNTWSGKPSAATSNSTANRQSSWSSSGKGSSWSSGGKSSGKNNASGKSKTSDNTSWGTGGSNNSGSSSNSWNQGGKANSKQGGRGVIRNLLKKGSAY